MKFEEFEKKIKEKGYGIVAMNHYTLGGKWHTYCVVLSKNSDKAIKAEDENSEDVFKKICEQIRNI
jgi:hypothetical protein